MYIWKIIKTIKNKTMEKKTIDTAKRILEVFPSFNRLMNDTEYSNIRNILNPLALCGFQNSQEWEGIAIAVNNMCICAQKREFYKGGYFFPGNSEKGTVKVLDVNDREFDIDNLYIFKALILLMYCNWNNLGCFGNTEAYQKTRKQFSLYVLFLQDPIIAKILD